MKKRLACLILAALLGLSLFSCNNDDVPSGSSEGSAEQSDDVSETVSDDGSAAIAAEEAAKIDAMLSGGVPDRTLNRKNELLGLPYKLSRTAGSGDDYADPDGTKLTDGNYAEAFNTYTWTGFAGQNPVSVDFDLGEEKKLVSDVEIGCLRHLDYGIGLPDTVTLYASEDGEEYIKLGTLLKPDGLNSVVKYTYSFKLQESVGIRYLRIVFSGLENVWFFIDEISAYSYSEENEPPAGTVNDYYGDEPLTETEPVYWPETDPDYDKTINLSASNAEVYVYALSAFEEADAENAQNTLDPSVLTDGVYSSPSWTGNGVFRMTRGDGREIVLDLGKISTVESVDFDLFYYVSWGIYPPDYVGVSVSENGVDWQGIATVRVTYTPEDDVTYLRFTAQPENKYKARYVKLSMLVGGHSAISEITVNGTKKIQDDALSVTPGEVVTQMSDSYMTPDKFGGIENILCTPICRGDGVTYDENAMITAEEFARYVAYYEDGEIKDMFFDTFLFSPCSGYTAQSDVYTLKGWKFYLESQFVADRNLNALDEAVADAAERLGRDGYKANIFLSILRTFPQLEDGSTNYFGDIDGDGVNDSFDSVENRKKAVKWMIDTQLERYEAAGFDNLSLRGFYWQEETIHESDPDELEVLRYACDYVHSLGYVIMWIPFYQAGGFEGWSEYGFDMACLQPNYSFMSVEDPDRLDSAAVQARMFGMCVEMELSEWMMRVNIERYKEYLAKGVEYGYMDAVKVYYLGIIPTDLTQALDGGDEYTSSVYRDTYLFAKGLLDSSYQPLPEGGEIKNPSDITVDCNDGSVSGELSVESDEYHTFVVTVSPRYGSLRLNEDGSFDYIPLKGYKGTDSFCVAADFNGNLSESATVTVNCG